MHVHGVAHENQGHKALYKKPKGLNVVGKSPIGHMNTNVNDCLVHTLPQMLCHNLSRVQDTKLLRLNRLLVYQKWLCASWP